MAESKGPDMETRDVNSLNSHVKVVFDEVFGEPDGVRSIDCVWRCSYTCFNGTLNCCYKFLTVLCGIPLAFCWGCEFACVACTHVWYMTPALKIFAIDIAVIRRFYAMCLDACLGPCCETCGLLFSKINVNQK